MIWKRIAPDAMRQRIFTALQENVNYKQQSVIGLPASHLDEHVFPQESGFLRDAPFLSTLVQNPNHIGCHTMGASEQYFWGTQCIEREVLAICAEAILQADEGAYDGYVAAGGTEANIQAAWIYRNYFMHEKGAKPHEIALVCSQDSHYSMVKASNLLGIRLCRVAVGEHDRKISREMLEEELRQLQCLGVKYAIVVANMMTTMFGSVDDISTYTEPLEKAGIPFKLHVDAAYGGFYYPVVNENSGMTFENPAITSFTLDAHKMVQAPYGTGIFLIRKGYMHFAATKEASYVQGEDCTLSGSRSGANAVSIWLILSYYGRHGWFEKLHILQRRTDWLEQQLKAAKIPCYRNAFSNILALPESTVAAGIAAKYGLVPDDHHAPKWYKIVVMEHVTVEKLETFLEDLWGGWHVPV